MFRLPNVIKTVVKPLKDDLISYLWMTFKKNKFSNIICKINYLKNVIDSLEENNKNFKNRLNTCNVDIYIYICVIISNFLKVK